MHGSDANTVWKAIYALVRPIGMSIDVEFVWEDKPGAAHPNITLRARNKVIVTSGSRSGRDPDFFDVRACARNIFRYRPALDGNV